MATPLDDDAAAAAAAIDADRAKGGSTAVATAPMDALHLQSQTAKLDPEGEAAAKQVDAFSGVPGSGTPQDPYKGLIDFTDKIQQAYQVGQSGMRESALGHSVAEGKMSLEEAQQTITNDEAAKWRSDDIENYEKKNWGNWAQGLAVSGTLEGAKSLPAIAEMFSKSPEGADYITGAGLAPMLQQGRWTMHYVFGQDYMRRRQAGAPHEEAVHYAGANAIGQGVVQVLTNLPLGGLALNVAKEPIKQVALPLIVKAAQGIGSHLLGGTKFVATQEGLAMLNSAIKQATDAIEATVHERPGMMPTVESAAKEFGETFQKTLGLSMVMHGAGVTAGMALRTVAKEIRNAATLHLQAQNAKLAKIEELKLQISEALQGHVEEDVNIKPESDGERAAKAKLATFNEQKQRLAYQEGKLTAIGDELARRSRKGEDTTELQAQRDELMKDTKLLSEIVEAEEGTRLAQAKKRLNRVIKKTIPTDTQGSRVERAVDDAGKPDSRLQQALDLARHFVEKPEDAADLIAKQSSEDAAGKPVELGEGAQLIRDIANMVGDIREKDSQALNALADQIDLAYQVGRKGRLKQILQRNAARDARIEAVKAALQLKGEVSASVNRLKKPTITPLGTLRNGVIGLLGNWEQAWYPVLRGMEDGKAFYDDFLDPGKIINEVGRGQRHWNERRFELLATKTGKTKTQVLELQRLGRRKNQVTFETTPYKNDNGKMVTDEVGMSAMEAVKLLGEARNSKLKTRFIKGNHFPEDFENTIRNQLDQLDPAYAKMPDAYEAFYKEYGVGLNETHIKDKGVPMKHEDHYAGYVSAVKNEEIDRTSLVAQLEKGNSASRTKGKPGFLEKRTAGDSTPIAPQDAEQAARAQVSLGERYKAWLEPSKEIYGPLLRDRALRTMIRNKAGSTIMNTIDFGYKWMLDGSARSEVKFGNLLDKLFSSIRFNTMANNWLYMPEHFLSQVAGAQYVPIWDYTRGLADYYHNPFKLVEKINNITKNSDIWQARYEDVEQTVSGSTLPKIAQNPNMPKIVNDIAVAYHKFGMKSIEYGSMTQVLPIMHSTYTYFKRQGLPDAEAMYKAGMIAENVATSMRADLTSTMAKLPGGKFALMFQQQINKFGVDQIIAADKFLANPTTENFQKFVKVQTITALAGAVFPLVRESYNYLSSTDPEKKDDAIFRMQMAGYHALIPGSSMFGVGQATDALMTAYHNAVEGTHSPVFEFSVPALDVINKNEKFAEVLMDHWVNDKWSDEDNKMLGALFMQGPGGVVPLGTKAPAGLAERLLDQ